VNLIAIDIGNTNIDIGLYLKGEEKEIESTSGDDKTRLSEIIEKFWRQVPVLKSSKEKKRDGVIVVCSVKPAWTKEAEDICKEKLGEKILLIGKDIPLPMPVWVDEPDKIGTDRVIAAFAAYSVVESTVVVADFGSALTIDMVDTNGVFQGGVICPGFAMEVKSLNKDTAQLPEINVTRPKEPFGKNTEEAINCGIYFGAVGTLQEVLRRYAESIGTWPQTIITGAAAKIIQQDCEFIDNYVTNLVVKGIALTYRKYVDDKSRN
jgi:type III pantothenate kinase